MVSNAPDLQQAWDDACVEFKKATGLDLAANSDTLPDGDDIVNKFKDYKAKDAEGKEKLNKAKKAVKNTLVAVERIGQVAAQGASMVFGGPASLTMNCISFLIDAGVAYKNIAHNIDELFSRIATVMERFQIYRAHEQIMHPAMIRVAHRLLMAVISMCAKCIEVLNKNAFLKLLKVAAFSSDGGIKSQFDVLAALEAEELQMKGTLTLVATETSKRDIAAGFEQVKATGTEIFKSVSQLSANSAEQAVLTALKEKLDVDDSISKAEYRTHQNKLVSGSCSWIKDDSQYQSWSDVTRNDESLLILKGDEATGKSYAMTAMIRALLVQYPQGQSTSSRTSIGYHYLTKASRREAPKGGASISKAGPSIRDALKSWAWQAVNNDLFLRKDIAAMFKKESELGDLKACWQTLFLDHLDKGANFLLLLDGVHELDEHELNNLIDIISTLGKIKSTVGRMRVMITSRLPFAQRLSSKIPYDASVIEMPNKTRTDMEIFIREKASSLPIFQKAIDEIQQLKERVCSGLLDAVNGSFLLANVKLDESASKYDPEEVMQVVQRTKDVSSLTDSILEDIRECNRTLTARELQNLNTLLLWAIHGDGDFLIKELEAILYIQQGKTSLQPLSGDIRDKYAAFLKIDGDEDNPSAVVSLKYDSIFDYFINASKEQHSQETTANQSLSKSEIQMVQHFIEKLCDADIYGKLGLKAFFDQKLSHSNMTVAVDCENAHASIALTCLRVLTGEFSEEADGLLWYSGSFLTHHLEKIDLDNIDPRLKAELGPRLVTLFTDSGPAKKATEYDWMPWSYNDTGVQEILRLLRSSAVMKKITGVDEKKQEWVDAVMKDAHPEIALLQDIAKVNAELWLSVEDANKALEHFEWLFGYLNKIECKDHSDSERFQEPPPRPTVTTKSIEDVLEMAVELHASDLSKPIVLRNIAVTYRRCEHIPEAIEWFNRALAVDADFALASAGLALAYGSEPEDGPEPDWEKALFHCNAVIDHIKQGKPVFTGQEPDFQRDEYLQWKASWLRKLFRYDEACAIYNELIQKDSTDDHIRLELIYTFCEAQTYGNVVEMLQELQKEVDEETNRTTLSRFFRTHGNDPKYHHTIVQAFKQRGNIREIKNHYREAVKDFKQEKIKDWDTNETRWNISYHFGAVLYTQADAASEKSEAVEVWEQILAKVAAEHRYMEPVMLSAKRLARLYIAKAIEAGSGTVADEMLAKVRAFAPPSSGEDGEDEDAKGMGLSHAEVRALVGRYYSAVGDIEKAKDEIRPSVDVGIKLLSDEDPENDWQGYVKLADALMHYRDDANAIAAWSLIQPTEGLPIAVAAMETNSRSASNAGLMNGDLQSSTPNGAVVEPALTSDAQKEESEGDDSEDAASFKPPPLRRANTSRTTRSMQGPIHYNCDGRCGKSWTYSDDVYVCRECVDVQFDAGCIEKLRQGNIGRDICDPSHTFMYVPPWDIDSLKRAQQGKVLVGDQVLEVNEWLNGIKREWGLT